MRKLADQIAVWLRDGVIQESTTPAAFLSLLFPVPKKGTDKLRWVLDSRSLNERLVRPEFRLEGINHIRHLLRRDDWLCSLDIKDAFLQVPMNRKHRRYLAFRALGRQFQFTRMIFGLTSAPYDFTRLLKPVMAALHKQGIRATIYLDDMLIAASGYHEALLAVNTAAQLLTDLGFPINYEKSQYVPVQRLEHLGMIWNTVKATLSVPLPKLKAIAKDARRLLRWNEGPGVTPRQLAGIAGKITAAAPGIRHAADFRRHAIQRCVNFGLRHTGGNWDATIHLSATAIKDLRWWTTYSPVGFNGVTLHVPAPDAVLTTDASPTGWGAVLTMRDGSRRETHGFFKAHESQRSSNWRETTGVTRAFFAFRRAIRTCTHLRIESDNTTAVSILRRFGSRHKHLGRAADPLLRAVLRWGLCLQPIHLPGDDNRAADRLSRIAPERNEWSLSWEAMRAISRRWGRPTFDWFATHTNAKTQRFCARHPDPRSTRTDAFIHDWADESLGLFVPPLNLIPRVLAKILDDQAPAILVVPWWPTRPWFSAIQSQAIDLLVLPDSAMVPAPGAPHPMRDRCPPLMLACRL